MMVKHPTPWIQGDDVINGPGLFDAEGKFVLPLPLIVEPAQQAAIDSFLAWINGEAPKHHLPQIGDEPKASTEA